MEILKIIHKQDLGLVIDPVIKATTRLELEDGLKMEVLPGGCWYPCGKLHLAQDQF